MLEKVIEAKLVKGIKRQGGLCLKWVSPGYTGVPDRIVVMPGGRVVLVEMKQKDGRLSTRQEFVHRELRNRGADVRCLWTMEDVDRFLQEVGRSGV